MITCLRHILLIPTILGVAVMLTACSDYRGVNEKNPYFQKAEKARQRGNYNAAENYYLECLKFSPDSSKAHLQLAIIYEENRKDYPRAIIHYKEYLNAVGENADVSRMVERVEKMYMAELYRKYQLKAFPPSQREPVVAPQAPVQPQDTPSVPEETVPAPNVYVIKEGDNLSTISNNVYGTSKHWMKIFEANRDKLPTPEKLKVGQKLIIPNIN